MYDAGPGQGRRAKQKEVLGDDAKDLHKLIPNEGLTIPTARNILQDMRGLEDTMDTYVPARAARYVSYMRRLPNLCKITGSGPGLRVMKADPPAQQQPRPTQSSTDRAPRTIEVDPRAAYRRLPHGPAVVFKDKHPARPNGERYKRYEKYKKATTIGQARSLGATSQDISLDLGAGAVRLL